MKINKNNINKKIYFKHTEKKAQKRGRKLSLLPTLI